MGRTSLPSPDSLLQFQLSGLQIPSLPANTLPAHPASRKPSLTDPHPSFSYSHCGTGFQALSLRSWVSLVSLSGLRPGQTDGHQELPKMRHTPESGLHGGF